jgi:hypothetical protein
LAVVEGLDRLVEKDAIPAGSIEQVRWGVGWGLKGSVEKVLAGGGEIGLAGGEVQCWMADGSIEQLRGTPKGFKGCVKAVKHVHSMMESRTKQQPCLPHTGVWHTTSSLADCLTAAPWSLLKSIST